MSMSRPTHDFSFKRKKVVNGKLITEKAFFYYTNKVQDK